VPVGTVTAGSPADRHLRAGTVARACGRPARRPDRRHLARGAAVCRVGREVRDRRGLRRARHRQRDAHGSPGAQRRAARPGARYWRRGWPLPSSRCSCWAAPAPGCWTTAGRW
jgi:hypothetical protein